MYLVGYIEFMKEKIDSFKKEFQQSDYFLKELNNNFTSEDLNDIDGIILNKTYSSDIHSIYRNFLSIKKEMIFSFG